MCAQGASEGIDPPSRSWHRGGVRVAVSDRQRLPLPHARADALAALAGAVLAGEGTGDGELTLSFVDASEMQDLHVRYMGEPGPTDVLSFPLHEDGLLGDVVVCPAVARANRPDDPAAELRLLVVHGVLHVLGHDHQDDDERTVMWALQARYSGTTLP
jgi:probable rRNA maturation factor